MKSVYVALRIPCVTMLLFLTLSSCDDERRNGYMLDPSSGSVLGFNENPLNTDGFDWWWHSFVGRNRTTGELQPFFIEYYVINPGLGGDTPILGQLPKNKDAGVRPSYAMLKAGTWAENASLEINNYYGISDFHAQVDRLNVTIGDSFVTETELVGQVAMSAEEAASRPECMSDAGTMSWNLRINKVLSYSVGYAAAEVFRNLNAFQMFWHVPGMKSELEGTVILNGEIFDVTPAESAGYQDKNWGNDYTNPWIWLNCNRFVSELSGKAMPMTSLDIGGGDPRAFNISLGRKALIAFYHEGELYEWNFTKELLKHDFDVIENDEEFRWLVEAADATHRIVVDFSAPKSRSLCIHYENPRGEFNHRSLWNTGWAEGTVEFYRRSPTGWVLIDRLRGEFGGAEYGEY